MQLLYPIRPHKWYRTGLCGHVAAEAAKDLTPVIQCTEYTLGAKLGPWGTNVVPGNQASLILLFH